MVLSATALLLLAGPAQASGLEDWIQSFAQSDFHFNRAESNAPMPPLAWLDLSSYGSTEFTSLDDDLPTIEFEQTVLSQAALLPIMAGTRDAFAVGEWISAAEFSVDAPGIDDFNAISIGLPLGWVRQASPKWQVAAFVAPLGHKASLRGSSWNWEGMAGTFGRYTQGDRLSWVFGFYADVSAGDDLYIPYVGANWIANEQWTVSAILPWPGVTYAPTQDTSMRLGVAPSGASWALSPATGDVSMNLDSWNFGLSLEHRVWRGLWLHVEGGVSGLNGMSFSSGRWNDVNTDLGSSPYVRLGINFRPPRQSGVAEPQENL